MDSVFRVKCVAFVALLFAGSPDGAFVLKPGQCPEVPGQTYFEKSRYLGVWFEYQRFPERFGDALDCTSSTFHDAWYGMRVTNNATLRADVYGNKLVLRTTSFNGMATVPDQTKPAELNVVFRGASPHQKVNYVIHDTDYTNYAVVFSCTQMEDFNIQYAWILTRVRGLAPPNLAHLESKLTELGIDITAFFVVHQKGCPDM